MDVDGINRRQRVHLRICSRKYGSVDADYDERIEERVGVLMEQSQQNGVRVFHVIRQYQRRASCKECSDAYNRRQTQQPRNDVKIPLRLRRVVSDPDLRSHKRPHGNDEK